jgi:excisionase family DNA binding protein
MKPPASPPKPARMLTVDAVAEHLDVSTKSVRRWVASGALVAHRMGRLLRVSPDNLRSFLNKQRTYALRDSTIPGSLQ